MPSRTRVNGYQTDNSHNDVVLTGISGRFPESETVEEFKQKLFDGVDLVTDDERRWKSGLFGLPSRNGKIKNLQYFDASFFGIHAKQADTMDPQLRLMLEITYEAIIDAGLNPNELRGTKTGVFIGACGGEAGDYFTQDPDHISGYALLGCTRSMLANRVSYCFDFKGPSYVVDSACSSSFYAFQQAVTAIKTGQCDSAIVGGLNLVLKPANSIQFLRLNMLSQNGMCKAFDDSGDGYVRSEAAIAILLQKANASKRIYATVLSAKSNNDGYKEEGITYPSGFMQNKLIREIYNEIGVKPEEVSYIETHGTGTKVGDPQETNSIVDFFCKNRKSPLLIGSVKTNMGHSESASGLCAIAKVVLAMEAGMIPQNLHFEDPNKNIPGLHDGRLKVVTKNEPWNGGIVGINSFGFGGANVHVVLRSNHKPKTLSPAESIPRIVGVSGRTEEAVNFFLTKIEQHKNDQELLALIDEIHSRNINGHRYRGYAVLKDQILKEVTQIPRDSRQIAFIFSGMGSQWAGMAKDLIQIECFKKTIRKCADALKPYDIDLEDIVLRGTEATFDNVLHSFVAIAAMQVALTDLLRSIKIEPDFIIGHSVGEVGCAYADGTFSAEQTVLAAYFRGRAIQNSTYPPGAMASIGLSWEKVKERCPSNVFPACNNCEDNVTISGEPSSVEKLVAQFKSEGIFAKAVNSSGTAFHCKYIANSGPLLRKALEDLIPNPKRRSSKWISSSIPESDWNSPLAQHSSASYHVNNLLSPVLFYDALKHLPKDVITIEIAPTGLLQAILKRALDKQTTNISLVKRGYSDNLEFFLSAIGKIYIAGGQPRFGNLYHTVSFPVGRGTPMINSMIEWDHSTEWTVPRFAAGGPRSGQLAVSIDIRNENYAYLSGHIIDGRILFPATGYLELVWSSLAKFRTTDYNMLPIIMKNVEFRRATILPMDSSVQFLINIFETGEFEVCEGGSVVVSGQFIEPEDVSKELINLPPPVIKSEGHLQLSKEDVYKELRIRGYEYEGLFMGITECDNFGKAGKVKWNKNWTSFLDTLLQFYLIGTDTRGLFVPTRLQRIVLDPVNHLKIVKGLSEGEDVPISIYRNIGIIKCGGIELRGLKASAIPRRQHVHSDPVLEQHTLLPYENLQPFIEDHEKNKVQLLTIISKIVFENASNALKLKIVEVGTGRPLESFLTPILQSIYQFEPKVTTEMSLITLEPIDTTILKENNIRHAIKDVSSVPVTHDAHLVILGDILKHNRKQILENAVVSIKEGMFLLLEEPKDYVITTKVGELEVVSKYVTVDKVYLLLRKPIEVRKDATLIQVTDKHFKWIEPLKEAMRLSAKDGRRIYLFSQGEHYSGISGMTNCLRKEPGGNYIRSIVIEDENACKFAIPTYEKQLRKDLVQNVLRNNEWGSLRHLPIIPDEEDEMEVQHAYINTLTRGDLSSLKWIEGPLSFYKNENPDVELCSVYYGALNFRDIMLATGRLPPDALPSKLVGEDCILGLEFSGRNSTGKRVMGMVAAKSLATTVLVDPKILWDVPDDWSLEDAATVPVVYATSYYALILRGHVKPGESLLIHAGTGGVGQAAITIALHMGCNVFTTVSNQAKREFLKEKFPQLQDQNIGSSRDTSFEQMIMTQTDGQGVDLVLNSLAGDLLQASVRCLKTGGRFLEIGKVDLANNSSLGMHIFLKDVTFHGILLDVIILTENEYKTAIYNLVSEGLKAGVVKPLPRTIFDEYEIEKAFRYMATGKHIGKVLLKIREEEKLLTNKPAVKKVKAIRRSYMNPEKSYVIVGGLGGLGLELANWLIIKGAQNIILNSRNGVKTGYQSLCVRRWKEKGIKILISTTNATTQDGARILLEESNKLGSIGGIFNVAGVIKDALLEDLSEDDFQIPCRPKINCSKYLDVISRKLAPNLDYFVNFSSISSGRGNPGQANYGWANSAMERLTENRRAAGYHGITIQWGLMGDVGMVLDITGKAHTEMSDTITQKVPSYLATMDFFLRQPYPVVGSTVVADKYKKGAGAKLISVTDAVANILGFKNNKNIDLISSLVNMGMDSLMGAEIKQTLERNYDIVLNEQEIRTLTFGRLLELSDLDTATTADKTEAPNKTNGQSASLDTTQVPNNAS